MWRFESVHGFGSVGNLYHKMHFAGASPDTASKRAKGIYETPKKCRVEKTGEISRQITDKDLRTLVLRPLSYFTSIRISGIIEVQKEARRSADVYGKKRKAKQT